MSIVADAFQPHIVGGLLNVGRLEQRVTLADLVLPTNRRGFDLDVDNTLCSLKINFRDTGVVLGSLASDIVRFASAAFQSMVLVNASLEDKERFAWSLVQIYYAAFYAGNSLMRLLGLSFSNFEGPHCFRLKKIAAAQGLPVNFNIDAGPYNCHLFRHATGFTCTKARGGSGGAHEVFWSALAAKLNEVSELILLGPMVPVDAQQVFAKLTEFCSTFGNGGKMSGWLSSIRNDIQYRHEHNAWTPCGVKKHFRSHLARISQQWTRDPLEVDVGEGSFLPISSFVGSCTFLLSICLDLLRQVYILSGRGRSFAHSPLLIANEFQGKLRAAKGTPMAEVADNK